MRKFKRFVKNLIITLIVSITLNYISTNILPVDVFDLGFLKLAGMYMKNRDGVKQASIIQQNADSVSGEQTGHTAGNKSVNTSSSSSKSEKNTTPKKNTVGYTIENTGSNTAGNTKNTADKENKQDAGKLVKDNAADRSNDKDDEYLITFDDIPSMEDISTADKLVGLSIAGKISEEDLEKLSIMGQDGVTGSEMNQILAILDENLSQSDIERLMQLFVKYTDVPVLE